MGVLMKGLGLAVRAGVCGGTLFLLNDLGAFGDLKQGELAYNRVKSLTLADVVGPDVSAMVPEISLPEEVKSGVDTVSTTAKDVTQNFGSYWNCGVNSTFRGLVNLPDTTVHYANLAVDTVKENMK